MRFRITASKIFLKFGEFIKSIAVAVMKPEDLIEFGKTTYKKHLSISAFSDPKLLSDGLGINELKILENIPPEPGRLLVLGMGGGREAIALSKMGYDVTGTDFVKEMCESALVNGKNAGVEFKVETQEMSEPEFSPGSFDVVWLSTGMYSAIPSVKKRKKFLKKVFSILSPGGYFLLQFHWREQRDTSINIEAIKRLLKRIITFNRLYETGDTLWRGKEFIHFFTDLEKLRSELKSSGMELILLEKHERGNRGNAILKKNGIDT